MATVEAAATSSDPGGYVAKREGYDQLVSWFGWTTLREPERYTRAADKKKLARAAGELLKTGTSFGKPE